MRPLIWGIIVLAFLTTMPVSAHPPYTGLTDAQGDSCCDGDDCRPVTYAHIGLDEQGRYVLRVFNETKVIPKGALIFRDLTGDGHPHACFEIYEGVIAIYCVIIPPGFF